MPFTAAAKVDFKLPHVQQLYDLMTLEEIRTDVFRGQSAEIFGDRVFGGQVLGQALRAASYTADRPAHSLHAYFLVGGDPHQPVDYAVERVRDGRSFCTRQVRAIQNDQTIFIAMVSFAADEQGLEYQESMPNVPEAESLPTERESKQTILHEIPEPYQDRFMKDRNVDYRAVIPFHPLKTPKGEPKRQVWMRVEETLPVDISLHQAIVAFCSDYGFMGASMIPHGLNFFDPGFQGASLDHTIYFHKAVYADQWFLHDYHSTVSAAARGLNFGKIWQNGQLVASTVQEGLIRVRPTE